MRKKFKNLFDKIKTCAILRIRQDKTTLKERILIMSYKVGGYSFDFSRKFSYKRMTTESKTYKALCFIKYNPCCTKRTVQKFLYGEFKYGSYSSSVWTNLLADKLIFKTVAMINGRKTVGYAISPLGDAYIDYINRKCYCI